MYIQLENGLNEIFKPGKLNFLMFLGFYLVTFFLQFSILSQLNCFKIGPHQKSWVFLESAHFKQFIETKITQIS